MSILSAGLRFIIAGSSGAIVGPCRRGPRAALPSSGLFVMTGSAGAIVGPCRRGTRGALPSTGIFIIAGSSGAIVGLRRRGRWPALSIGLFRMTGSLGAMVGRRRPAREAFAPNDLSSLSSLFSAVLSPNCVSQTSIALPILPLRRRFGALPRRCRSSSKLSRGARPGRRPCPLSTKACRRRCSSRIKASPCGPTPSAGGSSLQPGSESSRRPLFSKCLIARRSP